MTVRELIAELEKQNPDLRVLIEIPLPMAPPVRNTAPPICVHGFDNAVIVSTIGDSEAEPRSIQDVLKDIGEAPEPRSVQDVLKDIDGESRP